MQRAEDKSGKITRVVEGRLNISNGRRGAQGTVGRFLPPLPSIILIGNTIEIGTAKHWLPN